MPAGQKLLNTLDQLGSLKEKPMFFQSSAQFWGALGVYEVLVAVMKMLSLRHRVAYRNVLLMLQDSLRREGLPEHLVWVYDDLVRRRYEHALVLEVDVDPEEYFGKLHSEILRDAKARRPCFDRLFTPQASLAPPSAPVAAGLATTPA